MNTCDDKAPSELSTIFPPNHIISKIEIVEIIDFSEMKLFEHAKGQHNIVFVLEKCKDKEKKEQNEIKLVKVKEHFDGKNVDERLTKLVDYIKGHVDEVKEKLEALQN